MSDGIHERIDHLDELHHRPGQPCVMTHGVAPSTGERTCRKWMSTPSITVVNCS